MAATCTLTTTTEANVGVVHSFAWVSHTDGSVSGLGKSIPAGRIVQIKVVPGASTSQPTNLFDLTLVDADGLDLLAGAGSDLSNAAPTVFKMDPPHIFRGGTLSVTVANAGDTKSGTVSVIVR